MKKRFALLRRKLKSVREEKLPGRAVIFSVAAGLLIAAFFTGMIYTKQELYAQEETQKHLAQEVFRFHVLANSDSEKDQNLKLQVRDAVLDYMKEELSEEPEEKQCLKQTVQWARTHTDEIRAIGEKTVAAAGEDQSSRTSFPEGSASASALAGQRDITGGACFIRISAFWIQRMRWFLTKERSN